LNSSCAEHKRRIQVAKFQGIIPFKILHVFIKYKTLMSEQLTNTVLSCSAKIKTKHKPGNTNVRAGPKSDAAQIPARIASLRSFQGCMLKKMGKINYLRKEKFRHFATHTGLLNFKCTLVCVTHLLFHC
jgi:hypothetical protein